MMQQVAWKLTLTDSGDVRLVVDPEGEHITIILSISEAESMGVALREASERAALRLVVETFVSRPVEEEGA